MAILKNVLSVSSFWRFCSAVSERIALSTCITRYSVDREAYASSSDGGSERSSMRSTDSESSLERQLSFSRVEQYNMLKSSTAYGSGRERAGLSYKMTLPS
jgi:hypothetical protein